MGMRQFWLVVQPAVNPLMRMAATEPKGSARLFQKETTMQCKVPNTSLPTYYHAARPGVFNDSQVFSWALNYDITTFAHGRDWKWKFIGWKRESTGPRAGQLGFIAEDPTNGERWFCGVCPYSRAYRRIHLMPVKQQVLLPVRRRPMLLGFFR